MTYEELRGYLMLMRDQAKRYEHLALTGRAGYSGGRARASLRCADCDFDFRGEVESFSTILERLDGALYAHHNARGGNCMFATHAKAAKGARPRRPPQQQPPAFNRAMFDALASGLIVLDEPSRTAKIITPPRPPGVGEDEWANIQQALGLVRAMLEGDGYTVTIEERQNP